MTVFVPVGGFVPTVPEPLVPPGSLLSGQNVWIRERGLEPRWKLSAQSMLPLYHVWNASNNLVRSFLSYGNTTNPTSTGTRVLGAMRFSLLLKAGSPTYITSQLWVSGHSNGLAFASWSTASNQLRWLPSSFGTSAAATGMPGSLISASHHTPPSLRTTEAWRGAPAYYVSGDVNVLVLSAGTREPPVVTTGMFDSIPGGTADNHRISYSRLSGAVPLGAADLINFSDRIVAWYASGIPTRVMWHVEGDPTDWTGVGSGYQDLVDMQGFGTRIFAEQDHMILATDKELWYGRAVGLPYVFQFHPLIRTLGIPYHKAALQTPRGIFWLGEDFQIYRLSQMQVQAFGQQVQPYLRDVLRAPDVAFFSYNALLDQLRLFFSVDSTSFPTRALVYDFAYERWLPPETYAHTFHWALSEPLTHTSATVSNNASGDGYDAVRSKNEYDIGLYEVFVTSAGTVGQLTASATSDFGVACEEEAVFAPVFSGDAEQRWWLDNARWEFAARSASSATVSWSTVYGRAGTAHTQRLAISASSNASQIVTYPNVSGAMGFTPRIQSTNGGWQLQRVTLRAKSAGKVV